MPAKTVNRRPAAAPTIKKTLKKCMSDEYFKRLNEEELDKELARLQLEADGEEEEEEDEDAEDHPAEEARPLAGSSTQPQPVETAGVEEPQPEGDANAGKTRTPQEAPPLVTVAPEENAGAGHTGAAEQASNPEETLAKDGAAAKTTEANVDDAGEKKKEASVDDADGKREGTPSHAVTALVPHGTVEDDQPLVALQQKQSKGGVDLLTFADASSNYPGCSVCGEAWPTDKGEAHPPRAVSAVHAMPRMYALPACGPARLS